MMFSKTVTALPVQEGTKALTWIHAPVFSLHRLQMRDQRLGGMWETLVMGSILSGQAMLTCRGGKKVSPVTQYTRRNPQDNSCLNLTSGIHRAQLTCAHLVPARVAFMAPPFVGQSRHWGLMPRTQVLHSQFPKGTLTMP